METVQRNARQMNEPQAILSAIWDRRSVGRLSEPTPSPEQLETIIKAGASAPDHGHLKPWRFIVFQGDARQKFGAVLAQALQARLAQQGFTATASQIEKEQGKLLRAPLVVAVCAVIDNDSTIPVVEQFAATAAACENMLLAATALGLGSMWRTGEASYDPFIKSALMLKETDMIAGWLYFGSADTQLGVNSPADEPMKYVTYWV
ncbi:MAG: nitroreductase [Actinomycetota bacterium]|nr:MAG: nitroreductase [Actinomycetota bacterium]